MLDFYLTIKKMIFFFENPCGIGGTVVGTQSILGTLGFGVRIPARVKDFSFLYNLQTGFRTHLISFRWLKKFILSGKATRV